MRVTVSFLNVLIVEEEGFQMVCMQFEGLIGVHMHCTKSTQTI